MIYLYLKALHIIFIVAWFAGLLYLPRLFIYHQEAEDEISIQRFRLMERRLYRGIMWPSAILATLLGLWLVMIQSGWIYASWLHTKLFLVILVWFFHLRCGQWLKQLRQGKLRISLLGLRVLNEVPMLLLIGIVWLVVVKSIG